MTDGPRDDSAPSGPTDGPGAARPSAQPVGAAGTDGARHRSAAPRSNHRAWLTSGRIAIALVALLVFTATGWEWAIKSRADSGILSRQVDAIVTDDSNVSRPATPTTPPAGSYAPENILLLGSDTRAGANRDAGNSDDSTDDGVANSDTLMLAHVSGDRQHVQVISIPRDLEVDAPTCKQWDATTGQLSAADYPVNPGDVWHINSAYSVGGPQCTVRAVQDLTGLQVDRVIGIDFAGFQSMVDALGGITMNICGPIIDEELQTVVAEGGVQNIGGAQALSLVRARKVIGDTESDLARIHRQQVVLSTILQQVTSAGTLLNPNKLDAFLQAFVQNTFTDNVTIDDLVTLAQSFGSLDPSRVTFYTLPTVPAGDGLELDTAQADAVFAAMTNDQPLPGDQGAPTGAASPTPSIPVEQPGSGTTVDPATVELEIVNGSGAPGVAGNAMEELNALGFAVTEDQLAQLDEPQPDVTVEYDPTNVNAAVTVAATVPGAQLVPIDGMGTTVRLVLGESFDGAFEPVAAGTPVTGTIGSAEVSLPADGSAPAPTSELQSVNAGAALCV